jgi:hypothetical protein
VSAIEGESALTERAQHQGETDGCRGPRGSEPFDQDWTEGGQRGSEPFDQDQTGTIRPGMMSGCEWH